MRKTRLVILPTKCLHQMGFLLLFLSCPVIGDWGRIRPETENAHVAIQRSREGTCGLQRDPSEGLLTLWRKNLSNQCLKDTNVEGKNLKSVLSTSSDARVRESLINLERKDILKQQRNIKARQTLENRKQSIDQQRRTLRRTEISQNRKLLNDRKVAENANYRKSVRNNNADFRRLSLRRIQSSENVGTRNEVLRRSSVRLHRNEPERLLKKNIPTNSNTRNEIRSDKMSRNVDEKLQNRRNDELNRSQLQIHGIGRQNDRRLLERFETRQLTFNREGNEESMRRDFRQPEKRNSRQKINKDFSARIKSNERESLMPIRSENRRRDLSSSTRRSIIRRDRRDNEVMNRKTESRSRRSLPKSNENAQNQRNLDIRQPFSDISVLHRDKRDVSQARFRTIYGIDEKIITSAVPRTTTDRNSRTNKNDARKNIIFADRINTMLRGEKKVKENLELQQLREYLAEEKSENFMNSLLKWTNLNGFDTPKIKDWIGNCFIGAAAYYLTSRQVKVI